MSNNSLQTVAGRKTVRSRGLAGALARFRQDRSGASFIEYIIVVGLVAIIAIAAFQTFGKTVVDKLKLETQGLDKLQPLG